MRRRVWNQSKLIEDTGVSSNVNGKAVFTDYLANTQREATQEEALQLARENQRAPSLDRLAQDIIDKLDAIFQARNLPPLNPGETAELNKSLKNLAQPR